MRSAFVCWSAVLLFAAPAAAQEATLRVAPAPHYAGEAIAVEVHLEGFEPEPPPECRPPRTQRDRLTEPRLVSRGFRSVIINGRRREQHDLAYRFYFSAAEPGTYEIGPFTVEQGNRRARTEAARLELEAMPETDDMRFRLVLPEKPVYVGQPVPIRVEWWIDPALLQGDKLQDHTLHVPLFAREDTFRFIDEEPERGDKVLSFLAAGSEERLVRTDERRSEGGRDWYVLAVERTLVPLAAGRFELPPATATADLVTRWKRRRVGPFEERVPAATEKIRAADLARTLVVEEVPRAGRPASFAGAVGRGFTLHTRADRSVVQVGDPITLTITLDGDGNLETAGLPPLDASGLPPGRFRSPAGDVPGIVTDEGAKVFEVTVRALDEGVSEIPPLEYSWFDTDSGRFETTRSQPIALSVRGGTVVSAEDVLGGDVDGRDPSAGEVSGARENGDPAPRETSTEAFTVTGADLSNARGEAVLGTGGGAVTGIRVQLALYGASLLVLGLAVVVRRRAEVDPALVARNRVLREGIARIDGARGRTKREAAGEIAAALRQLSHVVPAAQSPELERLLARCEAIEYEPAGDDGGALPDDLFAEASRLARAIRDHAKRGRGS